MSENNEYDFKPSDKPRRPKPGDPDFVPPIPIIEPPDPPEPESRRERPPEPEPEPVDPDVTKNKAMAILGYFCFVIPLVAAPNSKFARFHANQGFMTFILWCIAVAVSFIFEYGWPHIAEKLPAIVWFFCGLIVHIVPVALFIIAIIFAIMGIINAANGETKELPLVGHWNVIK